ncbi:TIGR04219 family outer membrane beta-barrel protein [Sulfurimonas sp.]|uniref:TIGR04219 family outer membrane beta-barrel protein n=1 Tax=Sulfurimonas sp. TaxID=2022749 RepID=UPI002AAF4901|nr:TIGR04219 family outer membrane beta-barrel protein [Sulfurimonas sp.]
MKKILTTLACVVILASSLSANAIKVELGVGAWAQASSGELSYTDASNVTATDKSKEDSQTQAYLWVLLKHPVPILPNLRLEYANLNNNGLATGSFKNFTAPTNSKTTLGVTEFDIIPYYNILDNTLWITLDLGLDLKVADIKYEVDAVVVDAVTTDYSDSKTVVIPLVYLRARVEIPKTNIGLESDLKYISYGGNTVYDARVKIDYTFDIKSPIKPAIELGYRIQKIKLEDDSAGDANVDLDFSGVYAGLMLRF